MVTKPSPITGGIAAPSLATTVNNITEGPVAATVPIAVATRKLVTLGLDNVNDKLIKLRNSRIVCLNC